MPPLHGIGSRHDLPLPFEMVLAGAGITIVITFLVLLYAQRESRYDKRHGKRVPWLASIVDSKPWTFSLLGISTLVVSLAGLGLIAGPDRITNPIFGFVFVWVWVGLVPLSLLFGDVWKWNPARALAQRFARPSRELSLYPGALGVMAFAFFELVAPDRTTLTVMRWWAAAWVLWVVLGVIARGRSWVTHADPFSATATTVAHLSPWSRDDDDHLIVVNPLRHLASWAPPRGLGALCMALLGATAFDSFSNVLWWVQFTQTSSLPREFWGTIGLISATLIVSVLFVGGVWLMRRADKPLREQVDELAPSLVPIVVGYSLAHYGTLLWLEGQRTAIAFSDPLGTGMNLFGTAELGVNTIIIQFPALIALAQVALIVLGHVLGIVVGHDIAIRFIADDGRRFGAQAQRQLGLLVAMVTYTVGGLILLFA